MVPDWATLHVEVPRLIVKRVGVGEGVAEEVEAEGVEAAAENRRVTLEVTGIVLRVEGMAENSTDEGVLKGSTRHTSRNCDFFGNSHPPEDHGEGNIVTPRAAPTSPPGKEQSERLARETRRGRANCRDGGATSILSAIVICTGCG